MIDAGAGDDYVKGDFLLERCGANGSDTVYGGPGDDYVAAGGGNDFVDVGTARGGEIADGGSGSDILLGGGTPLFNSFDGGSGSDVLFPATLRASPLGNVVKGGEGNDIAILVNGMLDGFIMGPYARTVSVPVPGDCQVNVPVSEPSDKVKNRGVSCKLIGPISIRVDGGTVSLGSEFYSQSVSWDPRQWRRFANQGFSALKGDLCLCDLPVPPAFLGDQIY